MEPETKSESPSAMRNPSRPIKRRARLACISCRHRKVRCDVVMHGVPCLNCKMDEKECVVIPGMRNRNPRRNQQQSLQAFVSVPPVQPPSLPSPPDSKVQINSPKSKAPTCEHSATPPAAHHFPEASVGASETRRQQTPQLDRPLSVFDASGSTSDMAHIAGLFLTSNGMPPVPENCAASRAYSMHGSGTHVHYSDCKYIEKDSIDRIEPSAALLLEEYGCFNVPSKSILDEFMRQYFIHIHPILPVMDEVEFLDMFRTDTAMRAEQKQVPLFLFQAILFLACSYVSSASLRKIGFGTAREARAAFYQRAKFLFDVCQCINNVARARCALMLTYHAPFTRDKASAIWLSYAIDHSKKAGAHLYVDKEDGSREQTSLKRLWWCCILRDRIMALGLRQQLQIKPKDFDFSLPGLSQTDFTEELASSRVYDTATKICLVHLVGLLCDLAVLLNDVLAILHSRTPLKPDQVQLSHEELAQLSRSLDIWYERAFTKLRIPTSVPGAHKSLTLFTNMIYIYYNTAKASLCHHRLLILAVGDRSRNSEDGAQLQLQMTMAESLRGITDDLLELDHMGLSQFLPNTFLGFIAFPYIWYLLDVRSKTVKPSDKTQRGLKVHISIMKQFRSRCETTDKVLLHVEKTVDFIQTNNLIQRIPPTNPVFILGGQTDRSRILTIPKPGSFNRGELAEAFLETPMVFLRISLIVEFSLSRGRFPSEVDFPEGVLAAQETNEGSNLNFLEKVPADMWWMCLQEVLDAGFGG